MKRKRWTEERIKKLKDLWNKGYTADQIALRFGDVTRNAVIGKIHRLGLSSFGARSGKPVTMPLYSFSKK
tara:strand:+ start:277 stop:486 length:210 start_codon:yes stop_codon:yes gene_type:complete